MNLTAPIFQDADKAREHLEKTRWPHGPVCPHCGVIDQATSLKGTHHRPGLYQCNACRSLSVKPPGRAISYCTFG